MNLRNLKTFLIGAATFFSIGSTMGEAKDLTKCASRIDLAGPCYKVHGRLSTWNGSPSERIWVIGTKRMLGISTPYVPGNPGKGGEEIMPQIVMNQYRDTATRIYADFVVCPFEKSIPGHMQNVCIESAKNIVVDDVDDKGLDTYRRVPNASTS